MLEYDTLLVKDIDNWGKLYSINQFLENVELKLSDNGFDRTNSRLVFSVCPDDVNRLEELDTIENALTGKYNGEFHLGGLGAYPMGGVSGLTAASHHPPDEQDDGVRKEGNLVLFVSPHMGIMDDAGSPVYGKIIRPGQEKVTSSCGAMMGFIAALKEAGSPEEFLIASDENRIDPTRVVLHNELIQNYSEDLKRILAIDDYNTQTLELFKLNHDVVANKTKEIIDAFLEKEHFEGNIAMISGITINIPERDLFLMNDFTFPKLN
ncbi:MAG: hypothetical protein GF311_24510 [Candidatus Lokiarchaeota archaeon]|nr:hypothetical protein [Candidatus Lokiarchaeota archaeon]